MREFIDIVESFGTVLNFDPQVDSTLFDLDVKAANGTITPKEVKDFGAFLRSNKTNFIRMYHGTSSKHDVTGKGLLPTSATRAKSLQSAHGFVYLAYDPNSAVSFARMAYSGQPGHIIVYAVDVLVSRLLPDKDQLFNKRMWGGAKDLGDSLAESMIYGRGARVRGKIDPMQLHICGEFDKHGHPIDGADMKKGS